MTFDRSLDWLINVAITLAIGVFIYWVGGNFSIPAMIRNYLPDGLEAYSLMSAMLIIWQRRIMIGWIFAVFVFSIGFEFLQSYHWIAGDFSWSVGPYSVFVASTYEGVYFEADADTVYVSHNNGKLQADFCQLNMNGSDAYNSFKTTAKGNLASP